MRVGPEMYCAQGDDQDPEVRETGTVMPGAESKHWFILQDWNSDFANRFWESDQGTRRRVNTGPGCKGSKINLSGRGLSRCVKIHNSL